MGVDGIVEILISPAYHIITITLVSVFIARPHQVNFKQTTHCSRCCSVPCVTERASNCRVLQSSQSPFMLSRYTGQAVCTPISQMTELNLSQPKSPEE